MIDFAPALESEDAGTVAGYVGELARAIAHTITVTSARWPSFPVEHPTDRTGVRVLSNDLYDVWLLRWPTGTGVTPHDHGASIGAFSVVRGSLVEVRWRGAARTSQLIGSAETVTIGRGIVHDVIGATDGSLSVHVYSPPLACMNFYDEEGSVVVRCETIGPNDGDREVELGTRRDGRGTVKCRLWTSS